MMLPWTRHVVAYIRTYIRFTYIHTIPTYLHPYIPEYLPTYIHTYIPGTSLIKRMQHINNVKHRCLVFHTFASLRWEPIAALLWDVAPYL